MVEILNANDNFPIFEDRDDLTVPLSEVRLSHELLFAFSITNLSRSPIVLLKLSSWKREFCLLLLRVWGSGSGFQVYK